MRKPKPATTADETPPPPGGRALGRARQFALSRGLPEPTPMVDNPPKSRKRAASPTAKPRKPADS